MIEKALQYIVDMKEPTIEEIDGETYSDKPLHRIDHNPKAAAIEMNTLTSLAEYIKSGIDKLEEEMIVHVQSPTEVSLYSKLDYDRRREYIIKATAQIPTFDFGYFIDHETFCINLQSKFIENENRALLLKFAGTIESGTLSDYSDDGITQKAIVKTGIASKGEAIVPSPAKLIPYRTFMEISQPESEFIFRMREGRGGGIVLDGQAYLHQPTYSGVRGYLLPRPMASDGEAWKKTSKSQPQISIAKCLKRGGQDRVTYRWIWQGFSPIQAAELGEMIMGFPKGWTDLNA